MIDNLKDAIAHAREVAKERNETANLTPTEYGDYINSCRECATEHEQLANWLTELQERREADRWIPVSERLPDDRESTYWVCTDGEYQCQCRWTNVNSFWAGRKRGWHWCLFDIPQYQKVTHWRPLPKAPESEADNDT